MSFKIQVLDNNNIDLYRDHTEYHAGDSGLDLFMIENVEIPAHSTVIIGLGIKCQLESFNWCPYKWVSEGFKKHKSYFIFPRSSISKTPLRLANSIGLVDSAYTGELKVALHNTSERPYQVKRGQRLVQLVKHNLSPVTFQLVDKHRDTTRGDGGFGSTGV